MQEKYIELARGTIARIAYDFQTPIFSYEAKHMKGDQEINLTPRISEIKYLQHNYQREALVLCADDCQKLATAIDEIRALPPQVTTIQEYFWD